MPVLDASALDSDPEGLAFLRAVLDQAKAPTGTAAVEAAKPVRSRVAGKASFSAKRGAVLRGGGSRSTGSVKPKAAPRQSLDGLR